MHTLQQLFSISHCLKRISWLLKVDNLFLIYLSLTDSEMQITAIMKDLCTLTPQAMGVNNFHK